MPSLSEAARSLPPTPVSLDVPAHAAEEKAPEQKTIVALRVRQFDATPIPWWLWWNVLSLDAPTVACVWSLLLLRASGFRARVPTVIALILAVWVIYTADRLLDSLALELGSFPQRRHSFCAKHRVLLTSLALIVGAALIWLGMNRLEHTIVRAGLILGVIVVLYLATIHLGPGSVPRFLPKEAAVGMIFAVGTNVPLLSNVVRFRPQPRGFLLAALLFGVLCSLNCLSIECWESPRSRSDRQRPGRPWIEWADAHLGILAVGVTIAALFAALLSSSGGASRIPLFAISVAACLTLILNALRIHLSSEALRVLADAALVLPALAALGLLY